MRIRIEFYGIPRQRAQTSETEVNLPDKDARLVDVLCQLAIDYPALTEACIHADRLDPSCAINIDGNRFVTDPATRLADGTTLLFMSADVGG